MQEKINKKKPASSLSTAFFTTADNAGKEKNKKNKQ